MSQAYNVAHVMKVRHWDTKQIGYQLPINTFDE